MARLIFTLLRKSFYTRLLSLFLAITHIPLLESNKSHEDDACGTSKSNISSGTSASIPCDSTSLSSTAFLYLVTTLTSMSFRPLSVSRTLFEL